MHKNKLSYALVIIGLIIGAFFAIKWDLKLSGHWNLDLNLKVKETSENTIWEIISSLGSFFSGFLAFIIFILGLMKGKEWVSEVKLSNFLTEFRYSAESIMRMEEYFFEEFYPGCSELLRIQNLRIKIKNGDVTIEEVKNTHRERVHDCDLNKELIIHKNRARIKLWDIYYCLTTLIGLAQKNTVQLNDGQSLIDSIKQLLNMVDLLDAELDSFEQDLINISQSLGNISKKHKNYYEKELKQAK
ncbi:hypothetical protein [Marinomonas posidonica]|uniref:hypothetical protein n=1 Tax=Marinomonas posidonica TaxID=936476 RepID=UPI003735B917